MEIMMEMVPLRRYEPNVKLSRHVHCILISMQIDYSYFILMYIHVIVLFWGDEIDRVNLFSSPFLL